MALVVVGLLVLVFFWGVTVGEKHEKRLITASSQIIKHTNTRTTKKTIKQAKKTINKQAGNVHTPKKVQAKRKTTPAPKKHKAHNPPSTTLKKGFYVQVGAFIKKSRAQKWKKLLSNSGYPALILSVKSQKLHRVVVGPYKNKNLAIKASRKINKLFRIRSNVVPYSKLR